MRSCWVRAASKFRVPRELPVHKNFGSMSDNRSTERMILIQNMLREDGMHRKLLLLLGRNYNGDT
jgi:hypothetical protein